MPSIPLSPGMTTSMRMMSGLSARASKIASRSSPASPTDLDVVLRLQQQAQAGADDGVVVDDQDADGHRHGTSATIVVPAPSARLDRRAGLPRSADAFAHPDQSEAVRLAVVGSKPRPSSSIDGSTVASRRVTTMLTLRCAGVLDDVRQRFLRDSIERRLDLCGKPLVAERLLRRRPRSRSARANVAVSRSSAGTRPKSSSAVGRSSTASRRTSWSVSTTASSRSAASCFACASAVVRAPRPRFRPSRIEVSAWPVSSWSSRASRRRSSSCAAITRRSASRATRSESSTAMAARAGEGLDQPKILVVEAGIASRACHGRRCTPIARSRASSGT